MTRFDLFARYRSLIDDWGAFGAALERPLPVCVWANPLRITPERLAARLAAGGVAAEPLPWLPGAFRLPAGSAPGARFEYLAGLYHVQEEVSLLPPVLLDPRPGERILDLCAAPGGKTAQIGAALGNRGTVVANDRDVPRLNTVRSILDRLGLTNVTTTAADGANYPPAAGLFDRVLADVPCTCEGTSRKSPEVLWQAGLGSSLRLAGVQRALLRKAVQLTRPGGRIVYSTCTYAPEENELVVADVLAELPPGTVRLLPARVERLRCAPGLGAWEGRELPVEMSRALRVWPHHNDTGGFFVAVLEKAPGTPPGRAGQARKGALEEEGMLGGRYTPAPEEDWLPFLAKRFGLTAEDFAAFRVLRRSTRLLAVAPEDHRPPPSPEPYTLGLPFLHTGTLVPKLTTAAAMVFGTRARRNVIPAGAGQAGAYLRREPFLLTAAQEAGATPGQVLVRCGEVVLGLGFLRRGAEGWQVESFFPKRWAGVTVAGVLPGLEEASSPAG